MRHHGTRVAAASVAVALCVACSRPVRSEANLFHNRINDLHGVLTPDLVEFDSTTSSDGTGSLRIVTEDSTTVRLFAVGDVNVENARLVYRAWLRTADVRGQVYLEMLCRFPGMGVFFSRALQAPLSGTTEWTSQETPFLLEAGQNPDRIALNLVITGPGTVWVDDVALVRVRQ